MLYYIVGGPIDPGYAAFALFALFAMITIMVSVFLVNRRGKRETEIQFELGKMNIQNADRENSRQADLRRDIELGQIASKREIEFKRIDSGLIDLKNVHPSGQPAE